MLKYNNTHYDTVAQTHVIIKNTKHRWITKQVDGRQ